MVLSQQLLLSGEVTLRHVLDDNNSVVLAPSQKYRKIEPQLDEQKDGAAEKTDCHNLDEKRRKHQIKYMCQKRNKCQILKAKIYMLKIGIKSGNNDF